MPTVVTRTYSNPANAQAAAEAVKSAGFSSEAVHIGETGGQPSVSVHAEFGEGQKATRILESHAPVGAPATTTTSLSSGGRYGVTSSSSSAGSSSAGAPGDLANEPAPFSNSLGLKLLSDNPAPFSSMFGWPLLSKSQTPSVQLKPDQPAPFSAMFKLPLLTKDQTPSVKLSPDDPAPLSKALGLRTLINNPAPLSSKLGLPLLTRDPNAVLTPATIIPDSTNPPA
jgi:hypothetical protein